MVTGPNEEIVYRQWGPSAPRAVFLLVHGLGAHGGRWEATADFFLKAGISSYAIELLNPVHSNTANKRSGHFSRYVNDILRLRDMAAANNPGKKIFLVGESMGGLISFLLAAERPGLFDGLICISPAFSNRVTLAPMDYLKMAASLFYNPKKQFKLPFDSSMCTRDIHYRNRMEHDPLEYRSAPLGLLFEILMAQARAGMMKNKLTTPVLFLVAGEDRIADPRAAVKLFSGLGLEDKALVEFPGMYHALSIELGKEMVFEEMLKWVEKRI